MTDELEQNFAIAIIREPNIFSHLQREYDPIRKILMVDLISGKENLYSQIAGTERLNILRAIQDLFEDRGFGCGGMYIHLVVYKPFVFDRKFTKKLEYLPGKMTDAMIPVSELDPEQMAEWEKYLRSVEFIKQMRMLVANGIQNIPFPAITTKYQPQNVLLAAELERAKRVVVTKLLPNIRDEEAQIALGLRYAAEITISEVTPDWFLV